MSLADDILAKKTLPTHLSSAEIRKTISREIRARSIFSARTTNASYLSEMKKVLAEFADGKLNAAAAREKLLKRLDLLGYEAAPTDTDTLRALDSQIRLNLILDTNRDMVASVAQVQSQSPETIDLYPAWKLERYDAVSRPRPDWQLRWRAAGDSVGWEGAVKGQYVALKSSPIWAALGNGVGGFNDTLGNPYPPFAFSSGMAWTDVDADTAEQLGLDVSAAGADATRDASLAPNPKELAYLVKLQGGAA